MNSLSDDDQLSFFKDSLALFRLDPYIYFPYWILFFVTSIYLVVNGFGVFSAFVSLFTVLHAVYVFFVFGVMYSRFYTKWFK